MIMDENTKEALKEQTEEIVDFCQTMLHMGDQYTAGDYINAWGFASTMCYLIFHTEAPEALAGSIAEFGPEVFNVDIA